MEQSLYELPEGWKWIPLEEISKVQNGTGFPTKYQGQVGENFPFLKVSDMNLPGNESRITSWNNSISVEIASEIKAKIMPAGTVIFPKIGAAIATNKKRMLTIPSAFDNNVMGLEAQGDLTADFLYWYLQGFDLSEWASSAALPSMKASTIKEHKIPLPPRDEQKRIVAKLDALFNHIDAAITHLQETLGLSKALFASALDGVFDNLSTKCPMTTLQEVGKVIRGSSPRPKGDPRYYGGPVPRLMVADVTRDGKLVTPRIDSLTEEGAKKSRPVPRGTLTIQVSGNPGTPAILAIDACIHDGFAALIHIDENELNNEYMYYALLNYREQNNRLAVGAIFRNLTTAQLRKIAVPIIDITEQKHIVTHLDALIERTRTLEAETQEWLEQLNALKSSLLDTAFRGQL